MEETKKENSLVLIGVGGAGCAIADGIKKLNGGRQMKMLTLDTDSSSGFFNPESFMLLGSRQLAGRGAGGNINDARAAVRGTLSEIDGKLGGAKFAVVAAGLGGGTGGGVSLELVKHLRSLGITSLLFGTMPFSFEGEDRCKCAESARALLENEADSSIFIHLDKVLPSSDSTFGDAMHEALAVLSGGISLFWKLLGSPGYISVGEERVRRIVAEGGHGYIVAAEESGENRALRICTAIERSEASSKLQNAENVICGVLGGDDMRVKELDAIYASCCRTFGPDAGFAIGTVCGDFAKEGALGAIVLAFPGRKTVKRASVPKSRHSAGAAGLWKGGGKFNNTESTVWNGENLDEPTYLRKGITLER